MTLRNPDQQFFDSFMLVVGILIGITVGLFILVSKYAIETQGEYVLSDPTVQQAIDERIEPIGQVVLAGSAELAAAQAAPINTPARVATVLTGPQVYNEACIACHAAPGVGGAPVVGDAAAWADRIAQGMDTLTDHALNGYQGSTGVMPAKGGRLDLSDAEVIAGIEYMLEQVGQ
jgi:cytochrome c5